MEDYEVIYNTVVRVREWVNWKIWIKNLIDNEGNGVNLWRNIAINKG